jgi:hypothetical protein
VARIPGIPDSGSGIEFITQQPVQWIYDPHNDAYVYSFMGKTQSFGVSAIQVNPNIAEQWCFAIYQQMKGKLHGVSWTSSTSAPSHSVVSFTGGKATTYSGGGSGGYNAGLAQYQQISAAHRQYLAQQQAYVGQTSPEPPKRIANAGFKIGELVGWRGWKVTPDGFLRSMSADVIWSPDEPMDGKTSAKGDEGVYAFKKCRDFLKHMQGAGLDVYGKVALWGDVIEHELGWRAEFAQVISLEDFLSRSGSRTVLSDLRDRYCKKAMPA